MSPSLFHAAADRGLSARTSRTMPCAEERSPRLQRLGEPRVGHEAAVAILEAFAATAGTGCESRYALRQRQLNRMSSSTNTKTPITSHVTLNHESGLSPATSPVCPLTRKR